MCLQIRGIKTNIPFMENVLRHPVFLAGAATTGFIEMYQKELFKFEGHSNIRANKLLLYLADMVRLLEPCADRLPNDCYCSTDLLQSIKPACQPTPWSACDLLLHIETALTHGAVHMSLHA